MKSLRIIIISALIILNTITNINSQSSYRIHLGTAIPISKFSFYGINDLESYAILGLNIGMQYSYRLTDRGLGLFAGLDFLYNGLNKEYKESMEKFHEDIGHDLHKFHAYFNIPISTGLRYDYRLNDKFLLFGNIGLTLNFLKISNLVTENLKDETDLALGLGGKIGIGILIKDRISVNIDYLGLGNHNVVGRYKTETYTSEDFSKTLNIHMLTLTAGLNF